VRNEFGDLASPADFICQLSVLCGQSSVVPSGLSRCPSFGFCLRGLRLVGHHQQRFHVGPKLGALMLFVFGQLGDMIGITSAAQVLVSFPVHQ